MEGKCRCSLACCGNTRRVARWCRERKRVAETRAYLIANGFKAQALSGDVPQKKRLRFMKSFTAASLRY
jgi:superfamily II DNA/RNA helicase